MELDLQNVLRNETETITMAVELNSSEEWEDVTEAAVTAAS